MAAAAFSPQPSRAWSASPSYLWEVPGKPVIVHIALEVVDRLHREVAESFRSLEVRGSEIGGLLLGAVQRSSPFEVSIQGYEIIPSEYKRGPLYQLSPGDLERFEGVLKQRVGAAMQIVGFFRSHTRKGLGLDSEDVAIFNRFFRKRYQVALLAKPFAMKPIAGAIFIREGRSLRSESSYKEFPFQTSTVERRGASAASRKGGVRAASAPASNRRAGRPSAVGRATVIPSESRGGVISCELLAGPAPAAAEPVAAAAHAPVDGALPGGEALQKRRSSGLIWIGSATLTGIVRAVKPICIAPSAKLVASLQAARRICITASAKLATVARRMWIASSGKLAAAVRAATPMWLVGTNGAALVVLSGLLFFPGLSRTKRPEPTTSRNTSALAFHVERSAGEFLLTWNRDADVIHEATHAVLAIADGEWQQSVDLDQAQLRGGGIVYLPSNSDINFQLTVTGREPWQTQSESVRVLRISPWATPERPPALPPNPVPKTTRAANTVALKSSKASEGPGTELAKAANEAAPQADDLTQSSGLATTLDLPDAPGLTSGPQAQQVLSPDNMAAPAETLVSLFQLLVPAPPNIREPRVGGPLALQNPAAAAVRRRHKPVFLLAPFHHLSSAGRADEAKPERAAIRRPQHGPMAVTADESQR
jgi:hypothetical protein